MANLYYEGLVKMLLVIKGMGLHLLKKDISWDDSVSMKGKYFVLLVHF